MLKKIFTVAIILLMITGVAHAEEKKSVWSPELRIGLASGVIQVRISEALTTLPYFTPAAIPGLFVGCLIANILGGGVVLDVIFGSLATLIGAALGYLLRKNRWLVPIPTVVANTLIIPLVLRYGYGIDIPYYLQALYIAAGEIAGSYILGELLGALLMKHRKQIFKDKDS